jgi:hypothetical protein
MGIPLLMEGSGEIAPAVDLKNECSNTVGKERIVRNRTSLFITIPPSNY